MDKSILNLSIIAVVVAGGIAQVCQQRGRRNCGLNAFYCYDEFTENWECQCELGFENTDPNRGPEFSCTDINECLIHQHNCGENTWCSNFEGGFHCLCIDGFTNLQILSGNAVCSDVNECDMNPRCPDNSICLNTVGSYNCSCAPGFSQGNGFCYDVNECEVLSLDVCGRNGACVNTVGSYNCQCADGSVNDTCEGSSGFGVTPFPVDPERDIGVGSDSGAVDERGRNGNINETGSRLSDTEPQNASVFIGVGVGLGLVFIGCAFAVGYVLFVRKRRKENRARRRRGDRSPPKSPAPIGNTNTTAEAGPTASTATPHDKAKSTEHQYYTIHPDSEEVMSTEKSPEEVKAMYSNHKINKKQPSSGNPQGTEPDPPIVYQIFDDSSRVKDDRGKSAVRICNAEPKRLAVPLCKQPSSGVLNYATIFDNNNPSSKTSVAESCDNPYSEVSRTSPMPSPSSGQPRKLVKISAPSNSNTYDRLERPVFREQAKGEYHKLYSHPNSPRQERHLRKISQPERQSVMAPYEIVDVPSDR